MIHMNRSISPLLLQEIAYWTFFYHKLAVHREMQYRFQTAHYQLLVKALDLGFRYNSLFAMNADGTIENPVIKFGKLRMTRVTTDMYGRQSDRPLIKVLLGYGFIFIKDNLYFRPPIN